MNPGRRCGELSPDLWKLSRPLTSQRAERLRGGESSEHGVACSFPTGEPVSKCGVSPARGKVTQSNCTQPQQPSCPGLLCVAWLGP